MTSLSGKNILVIDDSPDIRILTKKILENDGASVECASSVGIGLSLAKKTIPDLIILDLEIPGSSGFDFLKSRKQLDHIQGIPIVILSGKKDKSSVIQAIDLEAKDYILKPFRATLLLHKVRKALQLKIFLSYRFNEDQCPTATFSLSSEISEISVGGCQIETCVKLAPDEQIQVSGLSVGGFGMEDILMKSSRHQGKYVHPGRYANEVYFVGMGEEEAKKVQLFLKEAK